MVAESRESNVLENVTDIYALATAPAVIHLEAQLLMTVAIIYIAARSFYYCTLGTKHCATAWRGWRRGRQ